MKKGTYIKQLFHHQTGNIKDRKIVVWTQQKKGRPGLVFNFQLKLLHLYQLITSRSQN